MTQEFSIESQPPRQSGPPTRWQENHGSLLMAFVGIVFLTGACVLVYRQNRFVPPRFPESNMIVAPIPKVDAADPRQGVTIRVTGAANDFGLIKIEIFASDTSLDRPENAIASESVSIVEGIATWTMPTTLPEKFAVGAFHDENRDGVLNRNQLGIPTERYGFTRNVRALSGAPSFRQTVIDRPAIGETIDIFIR